MIHWHKKNGIWICEWIPSKPSKMGSLPNNLVFITIYTYSQKLFDYLFMYSVLIWLFYYLAYFLFSHSSLAFLIAYFKNMFMQIFSSESFFLYFPEYVFRISLSSEVAHPHILKYLFFPLKKYVFNSFYLSCLF